MGEAETPPILHFFCDLKESLLLQEVKDKGNVAGPASGNMKEAQICREVVVRVPYRDRSGNKCN